MDAPTPATPGVPRVTTQPCSGSAPVCRSQAAQPRGPSLCPAVTRQTRGNSGSYMILMKDDACLTGLHPVSASGDCGVGGALVPRASFPLASCPHQGPLSIPSAPMPSEISDKPLPPSRPQFPLLCCGGGRVGAFATLASVPCLGSRWGGGDCNSFLMRGLRSLGLLDTPPLTF